MKGSNIKTDWTTATTDPYEAVTKVLSCIASGNHAWIELMENGTQDFPITVKNPALDNPFNWEMNYGLPRSSMGDISYFNETEKDLTENWVNCFGQSDAIKAYQENGVVSEELFNGSVRHPVKFEDAKKFRPNFNKFWITRWRAKEGIPYHIPDPSVKRVFTICYTDDPINEAELIRSAGEFLITCADQMGDHA